MALRFSKRVLLLLLATWLLDASAAPAANPVAKDYLQGLDDPVISVSGRSVDVGSAPSSHSTSTLVTSSSSSEARAPCSRSGADATLSISHSMPSNAIHVPKDFIGFGFETAFINDYNIGTFSENLINSVAKRLGETLTIRIGGTSGDRVLFDPNQKGTKVCVHGHCPIGSSATYILGPSYFEGFKGFANQRWTFQAPVGRVVNYTSSLEYVRRAYAAAGADRINAIAIGNEPDTYGDDYTLGEWLKAARTLERRIAKQLDLDDAPIFEILDTASGAASGNFAVETGSAEGISKLRRTKYMAQHWYQSPIDLPAYGPAELQTYLMNHSAITKRYQEGYLNTLRYTEENLPDVDYVISECGSSLAGPPKEYQDAFAAALWYVDFNLYSMSLRVKRVDATHRPAAPHSFWVPDRSANGLPGEEQNIGPQVRGPYYAIPMLADFLGKTSGAILQLLSEDTKTAYALYDSTSGALSKVALVNLSYWSKDTGGARGSVTFDIKVGRVNGVNVKRLHADAGAHAAGFDVAGASSIITWGDETWSYKLDNGVGSTVQGIQREEPVKVCDGVARIVVPDSEAVIVYVSQDLYN